jgi:hypothetical protein
MIEFLENKHSDTMPVWNGWVLAIIFFICGLIQSFFYCHAAYEMMKLGLKVKVALVGMIYQKVKECVTLKFVLKLNP